MSWQVQALTSKECPEEPGGLQACLCTKNNIFASVSQKISSIISYSCSQAAPEEQLTARSVGVFLLYDKRGDANC